MMRKNQLKKLNLEKLQEYAKSTTNGQLITMVSEIISERNDTLRQKTLQLRKEIQKIRKQTQKTIKQINEAVKERLGKKEKITMDKNSRPTHENIKQLAQLYNYMQNQAQIIDSNNKTIQKVHSEKISYLSQIETNFQNPQEKFIQLDEQYHRLYLQCEKQHTTLNKKNQELINFKSHIDNIHRTIEQYRIKYENVESLVRQKQRELDHLATYFKTRNQEDQENIQRERRLSSVIQNELLKTQAIYNRNMSTNQQLRIIQIQSSLNKN